MSLVIKNLTGELVTFPLNSRKMIYLSPKQKSAPVPEAEINGNKIIERLQKNKKIQVGEGGETTIKTMPKTSKPMKEKSSAGKTKSKDAQGEKGETTVER